MEYPEHEKLSKVKDRSQIIGEFLDNLPSGLVLAQYDKRPYDDELMPARKGITSILAMYFGIDEDKLEAEKLAMLEELRKGSQ